MICNKLLKVGRPQKTGSEICPMCIKQGFSYSVTVKTNTSTYSYIRFRHNDRTLKDHDIDKKVREKEPLKYATEYNRSNEITTSSFNPFPINIKYNPIKHDNQDEAIEIVTYNIDMMKIPVELKDKIKKIAITEKEKDWILNSEPVKTQFQVKQFYNEILNSGLVTFGDEALEYGKKIDETGFIGNMSHQMDKFGMLGEVLKIRDKYAKISKSMDEKHDIPEFSNLF